MSDMLKIDYFKPAEFGCNCGCERNRIRPEFVRRLNSARYHAGVPFFIISGYRCDAHNKAVGGVADSAHTTGWAADIAATEDRFRIIKGLISAGFTRIGIGRTFIHADADPHKIDNVAWIY